MKPQVTIIMATYNRAHFIVETLHSIQQQTFQDWECFIIDDGGTDNTQEVIAPILEQDSRFQFLKRPDSYQKGLPGCRNFGLDKAQGDFIIFFDDDDIIHPDNLKTSLSVLLEEQVAFCHYQKKSFEQDKPEFKFEKCKILQKINADNLYDVVTQQIGLASCTVLWDKKCFETIRFKEELLYAEEWECYIRIISSGFEGVIISNTLYFNRKHPNSNTAEFYSNNPIRKKSKSDAILLVISNLKDKKIVTNQFLRHFIQMAYDYKEFNLFASIITTLRISGFIKLKWQVFYVFFPVRLYLYSLKKKMFS